MGKEKKKLVIKEILLYILITLSFFLIFLYITFPINKLKGYLEEDFKKNTGLELSLDEISMHFVTGIQLKNSVIMDVSKGNVPLLSIKKLKVWINPIKLLFKKISISLKSELYGGTLDGNFARKGKDLEVTMNIKNIGLDKLDALHNKYETNLKGKTWKQYKFKDKY